MRYDLIEIELAAPIEARTLADDASGLAALVRRGGRPVGFWMKPMAGGTSLSADRMRRLVAAAISDDLWRDQVRRDIQVAPADPSAFADGRRPSLTLAVCTRDRADKLARCLDSIETMLTGSRSRPGSVDVLVVDNAPSDDAARHAVEARPGVRYLREPKPGLDFARNAALAHTDSDFLTYLDDDVAVDPGWLDGFDQTIREQPDAAALTGLVLPIELESEAQIIFERRGGFRRGFRTLRYLGSDLPGNRFYPCGAGLFGAGANMTFRRDVLLELDGFDDALDTGRPLPGGGDLDIFYRVIRSGRPLVYEPRCLVFHEHRRDLAGLRKQYDSWGRGFMAFLQKAQLTDPLMRPRLRAIRRWWLREMTIGLARSLYRRVVPRTDDKDVPPPGPVAAELRGGLLAFQGEYRRSQRRIETLRRIHGESEPPHLGPERSGRPERPRPPSNRLRAQRDRISMSPTFKPWRVEHVDLDRPVSALRADAERGNCYVVFWRGPVPLGRQVVAAAQLPMPAAAVAELAAQAVAPMVGSVPFPERFADRPPIPWRMERRLARPTPALEDVLASERPIKSAAEAIACEPGAPRSVSVVLCTRGRDDDLARSLDSLTRLDPPADEVIVVDNGPAASTRAVVDRFAGMRYVSEPAPGLSRARNTGVRESRGEIVAFTDDDVLVGPNWIDRLRAGFRDERVDVVTGLVLPAELETEAQMFFESPDSPDGWGYQPVLWDEGYFELVRGVGAPVWRLGAGANMALRREAFDRIGLFDERLGAGASGCSEDSEIWYRVLAAGRGARYYPAAVVEHVHRRELDGLRRQMRHYMRGHAVALLVQFENHRHYGNLRRLLLGLPAFFLSEARGRLLGEGERRRYPGELRTQVHGWLAGMGWYLRHGRRPRWRDEPSAVAFDEFKQDKPGVAS